MNTFSRLFSAALIIAAASVASASTITIESYGTQLNDGTTNPFKGSNTALAYEKYTDTNGASFSPDGSSFSQSSKAGATYNLPTTGPWANVSNQNASWVSFNPGNNPGGTNVAPSGTYFFKTSFSATASGSGSITVLADDSTSVYLNDVLITPAAAKVAAVNCTVGTPNCLTATTYTLVGFMASLSSCAALLACAATRAVGWHSMARSSTQRSSC